MKKRISCLLFTGIAGIAFLGCANVRQHVSEGNQQTLMESLSKDVGFSYEGVKKADKKFQEVFW